MEVIDFRSEIPNKKQAAFVILYAIDINPVCLMINRADQTIGFVGGMVEEGESLEDAVKREVEEEIGHTLAIDLEPIVAHDVGHITTHAFAGKMTLQALERAVSQASRGIHFGSELTGVFLAPLDRSEEITKLIKTPMAPSVREELVHFMLGQEISTQTELKAICLQAGYSLADLLK